MRQSLFSMVALVAVVANGCGGSDKVTGTNNGTSGSCTATLSGAVTASLSCVAGSGFVAAWAQSTNLTAVAAVITGATAVTVAIGFPGQPTTGTHSSTGATATGGVSVTSGTSSIWLASGGAGAVGTYSLNLTSVSSGVSSGGGTVYTVHGTFDATLPPSSGTGASVTLHMTF